MPDANSITTLQTIPLGLGCILCGIYMWRARKERRIINYETIFLCFTNSIAFVSAILLIVAAYFTSWRNKIPEMGIYVAICGIVLGHMAWRSTKDRIFFKGRSKMTEEEDEIALIVQRGRQVPKILNNHKDLLVIVDIQKDFFKNGALATPDADSLIDPLNELIRYAEESGCQIVLTRDWHPKDHKSFKGRGGKWVPHCIQGSCGAQFPDNLYWKDSMLVVDIGSNNKAPDYSAFDDPRMAQCIEDDAVRTVYVVGIALEYCVMGTCLDAVKYGKTVIALEPYIRAASTDKNQLEEHWRTLIKSGVVRAQNLSGCTGRSLVI